MAISKAAIRKRKETLRLKRLCNIEGELKTDYELIAGVDEAGRGPLAGPVVAAACILPEGLLVRNINDSKKLSFELRYQLYKELILHPEICYAVGVVEAIEIDELNIHHASLKAMEHAIKRLKKKPQYLLVDGKHAPKLGVPFRGIVEGDGLAQCIAAASNIAKVTRDHIMLGYHDLYPEYGFNEHKGYGTRKHLDALDKYGPTPIHRLSFKRFKQTEDDCDEEIDEEKIDQIED